MISTFWLDKTERKKITKEINRYH